MRRLLAAVAGAGLVAGGLVTAGGAAGAAAPAWTATPLLSGLNAPRGIAVDNRGGVYVAEAGVVGTGAFGVTRTGAVSKYVRSGSGLARVWRTPFTSVYAGEGGDVDDLGPAGLSLSGAGCLHSSRAASCAVDLIMSVNHDQALHEAGLHVEQVGHLYRLNGRTGAATDLSDFGDQSYRWTRDHASLWNEFPDANPYGVLSTVRTGRGLRTFVADAGANTISEVLRDGTMRVIAYIPNETPPGTRDAVPTCIAQGPDGMLYVGALDLEVNLTHGGGFSNVWRVDPNSTDWAHNARLWATGFTTIAACMFDRAGSFWAAEMFRNNGSGPPPGDLARVSFANPGVIEHVGGGSLPLPGGVAEGPDGALYVTTGAAAPPGTGGVVRVARG